MTITPNPDGSYTVAFDAKEAAVLGRFITEAGGASNPAATLEAWLGEQLTDLAKRYAAVDASTRKALYDQASPQEQAELDAIFDAIRQKGGGR